MTSPILKDELRRIGFFYLLLSAITFVVIGMGLAIHNSKPRDDAFPPGQLVRHRMDGRIGVVLSNGSPLKVRFSCNYTTSSNFEVIGCETFELVPIAKEDEENLYWRRRERPPHSPDQTELP